MSPLLKEYLGRRVVVVTTDGGCLVATLEGFDKTANLLLSDVRQRATGEGLAAAFLLQGSQIVCCGPLEGGGPEQEPQAAALRDTRNVVAREHDIWARAWQARQARE
ncbi:ACL125Cp [Eremothecium gossypii ATCC 10895]|uniref:LSM2-LSM8 complex subunit LSM8 n=1 Tax=Eremothecium gossypii (strain ATCC 10895 / CBS 109.51 / FGSC 9923 / NRRL Y-1056) TaxID=284811 RepID=Q75CP4_EREGS|nr:ACL125Cp [Eremothecium gossypii ATCC 10895]AAS51103.1 ACL125Cp [Eremothecium gossypii ATCC 10895]AEY95393.1 FACL125Cp [Eremothecium gossypii FDAG1]